MKKLNFTTPTAQKIYDDYFNRVTRCTRTLPLNDQLEIMMEVNSHIYEATQNTTPQTEVEVLVNALQNFGAPEEVLQPLVADKKVKQATRTFNPRHIIQALYLNISNGIGFVLVAILYLSITAFGILIIAKLIYPNHTGLFIGNGHLFAFGFISDLPNNAAELLGNWFIPVVAILIVIFYFLNTLLFRLLKRK
ncbi:putative membrane protein [Mucilaginibacter frigoritolerans]|jgi:uncharacterized membrane protein|uniref:Putative membrane protein n=1 Tax=Mucilaginibacter frigoritolerans TaxID=652788 RepID=A0A562U6S1_9SPHI|nr:hypothetical protein [Mucilaginibacter frigoritolerans]TWJ01434.1 putative membrane protein [Mucilaginibacter frigoritolerans]